MRRSSIVERLFGAFLLSAFVIFVLPKVKTASFVGVGFMFLLIGLIAWSFGQFFSGEGSERHLVLAGMIVAFAFILYFFTPLFG